MLSSVLNGPRAIAVNIQIMRAFIQMRELLSSNKELARQFAQLERGGSSQPISRYLAMLRSAPGS